MPGDDLKLRNDNSSIPLTTSQPIETRPRSSLNGSISGMGVSQNPPTSMKGRLRSLFSKSSSALRTPDEASASQSSHNTSPLPSTSTKWQRFTNLFKSKTSITTATESNQQTSQSRSSEKKPSNLETQARESQIRKMNIENITSQARPSETTPLDQAALERASRIREMNKENAAKLEKMKGSIEKSRAKDATSSTETKKTPSIFENQETSEPALQTTNKSKTPSIFDNPETAGPARPTTLNSKTPSIFDNPETTEPATSTTHKPNTPSIFGNSESAEPTINKSKTRNTNSGNIPAAKVNPKDDPEADSVRKNLKGVEKNQLGAIYSLYKTGAGKISLDEAGRVGHFTSITGYFNDYASIENKLNSASNNPNDLKLNEEIKNEYIAIVDKHIKENDVNISAPIKESLIKRSDELKNRPITSDDIIKINSELKHVQEEASKMLTQTLKVYEPYKKLVKDYTISESEIPQNPSSNTPNKPSKLRSLFTRSSGSKTADDE